MLHICRHLLPNSPFIVSVIVTALLHLREEEGNPPSKEGLFIGTRVRVPVQTVLKKESLWSTAICVENHKVYLGP